MTRLDATQVDDNALLDIMRSAHNLDGVSIEGHNGVEDSNGLSADDEEYALLFMLYSGSPQSATINSPLGPARRTCLHLCLSPVVHVVQQVTSMPHFLSNFQSCTDSVLGLDTALDARQKKAEQEGMLTPAGRLPGSHEDPVEARQAQLEAIAAQHEQQPDWHNLPPRLAWSIFRPSSS